MTTTSASPYWIVRSAKPIACDPDAPPVCRDLLLAKLDAIDRGVDFPLAPELLSDRCSAFFRTLDITKEACRLIGSGDIPQAVRDRLVRSIHAGASRASPAAEPDLGEAGRS